MTVPDSSTNGIVHPAELDVIFCYDHFWHTGKIEPPLLQASKLVVTLAKELKSLPDPESLVFGEVCVSTRYVLLNVLRLGFGLDKNRPYVGH